MNLPWVIIWMRMAAPKSEQSICVSCGFCCDGTLFEHAHLKPGEKESLPPRMKEAWFKLGKKECFRLPCWYFNGKCSIYDQQKAHVCSDYRCQLLVKLSEGQLSKNDARQIVHNARQLRSQLMEAVSAHQNMEHISTFRQLLNTLREMKEKKETEAGPTEQVLLYARCNILEALLIRYFKPDKDFDSMKESSKINTKPRDAST